MKLIRTSPALIALALLCCVALPARSAFAQAKIAIVNAGKVFDSLQETKDLREKMQGEGKAINDEDLSRKTKLKDMQAARDALKQDTAAYDEKNKELMTAAIEYETWQRITTANAQRSRKQQMIQLFSKIKTAVTEVATSKGLDLVLAEQRPQLPENTEQLNPDQLAAILNGQNIFFSNPNIDITNDVINAMDAKYKSGK